MDSGPMFPSEVTILLANLHAPARLQAHLHIVHEVAVKITEQIDHTWPDVQYDHTAVLMGAAIHDIGKICYPLELLASGDKHEEIGSTLLQEQNFPTDYIRFTYTHARWQAGASIVLEDLLVAFADTIWKGKRDNMLELAISERIAGQLGKAMWDIYIPLSEIAEIIAVDADERIIRQGQSIE